MKTEVTEAGRCIVRLLLLAAKDQLKQSKDEEQPSQEDSNDNEGENERDG